MGFSWVPHPEWRAKGWFDPLLTSSGWFDPMLYDLPAASATLNAPTVLGQGASTTTFSFTPTAPTANSRLILTVVSALSGGGPLPSSISGLGVVWQLIASDVTGNGVVRTSIYKAVAGSGSGAVTITFGTTPGWAAWNLAQYTQSDGGTPMVQQYVLTPSLDVSPVVTLPSAPAATSITQGVIGYNAGSGQTLTIGGSFSALGTRQSNSSPAASLLCEYVNPATQTATFTTGNASGKVTGAIEIKVGSGVSRPTWSVWNGSAEVALNLAVWNGSSEVAQTLTMIP